MSKFRNRLMKRVMAVILSGAMVMSSMTSFAAETGYAAEKEYSETTVAAEKEEAEETDGKETDLSDNKEEATEVVTVEAGDKTDEQEPENEADNKPDADKAEEADAEVEADKETTADDTAEEEATDADKAEEADKEADEKTSDAIVEETEVSDEETTSEIADEEMTEEADDNRDVVSGNPVDLSGGLKAGTEYGDEILTFTVFENMTADTSKSVTVDGVRYSPRVRGTNDPKSADDKSISATNVIPTKGAAFKITTIKDAKITFVVEEVADKNFYFSKEGGELLASGLIAKSDTYIFNMLAGNTYYFCAGGTKINVYGISWVERDLADEANRPDWATFAKPVVTASLDDTDKTKVNVSVDTIIGPKGADKIEVFMYDNDGNEAANAASEKERDKATNFEFYPEASGSYTFKAVISRAEEEAVIEGDMTAPVDFVLPLTIPVFKAATSLGGGQIQVKWGAVAEAEKYVLEYAGADPLDCTTSSVIVKGLTVGQKYSFTVYAVRGQEETVKSAPIECTATEQMELNWAFSAYGNGMKPGGVRMTEIVKGKEVQLRTDKSSTASNGKIVPASHDGLGFYYTALDPNTTNFTFTARAHVNTWTYSNGQEGFGVMAADSVPANGTQTAFWNNSYQAVVSRISYKWNGSEISEDGTGDSIDMQIGVGSTAKTGVTPSDAKALAVGEITAPLKFVAEQTSIDTTFAKYGKGQYNLVGNCTNPPKGSDHEQYVNFELQIQKNNTGYFVSYTRVDNDGQYILDSNGDKITTTAKYYDTKALNVLEDDMIYVGVFVSRDADVTFSDMNLTLTDPESDPPAEQKPPKYLNLSTNVMSGGIANSSDYTFMFASNWNGQLVIKDNQGNVISTHKEVVDGKEVERDYYTVTGTLDPEKAVLLDGDDNRNTKVYIEKKGILLVGKNTFTVEYTPDGNWSPEVEPETGRKIVELRNYNKVTLTHTVEYRKYGEQGQTIYVSQNGKASNLGTKSSPLDIYTAVKYAQPGQTILLAGGRYSLTATLHIARGISGQPDVVDGKETYNKYIKMMAEDPANRPVLDFNSLVAAMVTVGDYWYFKNFDVIRCKDGEKGIQVSSSYCVFDRVDTYKNGSTGLQICRAASTDTYKDWPHDNLILNCNSYLNVDQGYEDADGFAAKLTSGSNNVFDGCIAAFNADDGWDLFAKAQTGSIGAVTIKNSIAYRNGWVFLADENDTSSIDENGTLVLGKGNGNGFKMGGDGLPTGHKNDSDYDPAGVIPNSGHKLYNSLSFYNKSKGLDSNSAPNIKAYNSIFYNNGASNINLTTYAQNQSTDYELLNCISFRKGTSGGDSINTKGRQDPDKIKNNTTYLWDTNANAAVNAKGDKITEENFDSFTYPNLDRINKADWRNEDGTINTHGFLQLKEGVSTDPTTGESPVMGGTPSNSPTVGEDTDGSTSGFTPEESGNRFDEDYPEGGITRDYYGKIWVADINYTDYKTKEPIYYTGKKIEPEIHVYFSADFDAPLVKGKAYSLKWENNTNAGTAKVIISGSNHYAGFKTEKEFIIKQIDINDNSVCIPSSVAAADGVEPETLLKPTWQGKALKKDVDYTTEKKDGKIIVTGIGNFTGTKTVTPYTADASKLLNKANVAITDKNLFYTGEEVKPVPTVKLGGSDLTTGYTVEYANNIEIGKATLTVVGDGVNYFGSKSINFTIKGGKITDAKVVTINKGAVLEKYEKDGFTYDGTIGSIPENSISLALTANPDKKLVNGVDYQIIQKGSDKAGSATVTIKGINSYSGAVTYKYAINPLDVNTDGMTALFASTRPFMIGGVVYTPGTDFNITYNNHVIDSSNYRLVYTNNLMAGDAKVTVVGQKLLKGSKSYDFKIERASMQEYSELFSITAREVATNGKDLYCSDLKKANVIPTQLVGKKAKKLLAGRDFDKKNGIQYYIDKNENYVIDEDELKNPIDVNAKTKIEEFTQEKGYLIILVRVNAMPVSQNAKCSFDGYVDGWFRVALYNVSKVKVKIKKPRVFGMNYALGNGESQSMVWDTETAKIDDYLDILYGNDTTPMKCVDLLGRYTYDRSILKQDGFAIVANSYKKNDRVGTASFTIQGTGRYVGTKKIPFTIISKNAAVKQGIWEDYEDRIAK